MCVSVLPQELPRGIHERNSGERRAWSCFAMLPQRPGSSISTIGCPQGSQGAQWILPRSRAGCDVSYLLADFENGRWDRITCIGAPYLMLQAHAIRVVVR